MNEASAMELDPGSPGRGASLARSPGGDRVASVATTLREAGPTIAAFLLPFVLILYLALSGGGYDVVARSQVGIAVWWIVLLGAAIGVLPAARITRSGGIALALLGAFVIWTAFGVGWSASSERSMTEVGRVAAYLGILLLALSIQGRGAARRTVDGVAAAIAVVAGLALLSRLHPAWFPSNHVAQAFPSARGRLEYPLGYWNGVAALTAIGIPLVLAAAAGARTAITRALAAAALPAMALAAFYTFSRGGAIEIGVALVVLLALFPRRLAVLPVLLTAGAGAAILIAAGTQRDALESGLTTAAAHSQGNEMLAMSLLVCGGAGLVGAALALVNSERLRLPIRGRRSLAIVALGAVGAIAVAVAVGLPGRLSDDWHSFKNPAGAAAGTAARFESVSGNGRYQYWRSTLHENATDPLVGTGPGTFQYWWNEHGTRPGFVQNAHSLYFETLGELGIVGLAIVVGLIGWVLVNAAADAVRRESPARARSAAVAAACAAFAVAAGIDWVWQIAVIPAAFLFLAAATLGSDWSGVDLPASARRPSLRIGWAIAAVIATVVIAIPLSMTISINSSQAKVHDGNLVGALDNAKAAAAVEPYAATPRIQEALVLELQGNLDAAAAAAREATAAEATNWRTWVILSRIEAERGRANASLDAYRRARSLDPRSPFFQPA